MYLKFISYYYTIPCTHISFTN